MSDLELANLVGSIYDAGSGVGAWSDVGDRLNRIFGGHRSHIWATEPDGSRKLVTCPNPDGLQPYLAHFRGLDPHFAFANQRIANGTGAGRIEQDLVNERDYLKSEFYNDFARRVGRRYLIGAYVAGPSGAIVAHFRDEGHKSFDQTDAEKLDWLLPHFQRALQLRRQLPAPGGDLGLAALDALPIGILLVDAQMRILFANAASSDIFSGPHAALRAMSSGGQLMSGGSQLTARNRQQNDALKRLVASAATKGPGGAMRMQGSDGTGTWALVASPAPARLTSSRPEIASGGLTEGIALIMTRNLEAHHVPPPALLSELFNLSKAEAEVSVLILGGAKAEDVARARRVSLDTVRSQIRMVLGKTDAQNLRDFERIAASLPLLRPDEKEPRG